jgi:hypothetical protein
MFNKNKLNMIVKNYTEMVVKLKGCLSEEQGLEIIKNFSVRELIALSVWLGLPYKSSKKENKKQIIKCAITDRLKSSAMGVIL